MSERPLMSPEAQMQADLVQTLAERDEAIGLLRRCHETAGYAAVAELHDEIAALLARIDGKDPPP